ncbi:MAG: 16S rRNA (cytidine(1402)-2'-O)-methyltransferase [Bacilli bacterium]|nr:16S rRNA (cytidine(1402)-2'-O)-methyltransferase [Bacilli bacterium]
MERSLNFDNKKPLLYLVATPIGNLEEMSPRALSVLKEVDLIACEDTRMTAKLLSFFNISKPLVSLREHNEVSEAKNVVEKILKGSKVAYVSDAGYPCISDPGAKLVQIALENDINVSTISGPSAFINALVASGLNSDHFYFHGFLSAKQSERKAELEELSNLKTTIIFYESPHRIKKTLEDMLCVLGNRKMTLARELTKKHEEYIRSDIKSISELDENTLIGEMVLVVEGKKNDDVKIDESQIKNEVDELVKKGLSSKDAIKLISEKYKLNKNLVYKIYLN